MKIKYVNINELLELCGKYKNDEDFIFTLKGIKEVHYKEDGIRVIILSPEEYSHLNLEDCSDNYGEVQK